MNLVKLTELDDYLTPALDCVVMANEAAAKSKEAIKTLPSSGKTKLMLEDDDFSAPKAMPIKPRLIKQNPGEDKASVNLYDCLACSGCVTSSEVVLLEVGLTQSATWTKTIASKPGEGELRCGVDLSPDQRLLGDPARNRSS